MSLKTCLMIGGGGMAGGWINHFRTHFADRVKMVGLADVNREVLERQGQALGLESCRLFTDAHQAIQSVKADFCGIAVPPRFHREAAVAALEAGMPVLCEKPIAENLEGAKAMLVAARRTGLPCAIIQNYRYAPNKQEVRRIVQDGRFGRLQHIVARYACDYRRRNSWGPDWRHDMDFPLLFEGSVHHLDMLRFLSNGDGETLTGFGWNPPWSSFRHHSSGMFLVRMNNGIHCFYEGNSSSAGITNCWHSEYYRLEFEQASVEIAGGNTVLVHRVGHPVQFYEPPPVKWAGHLHLFDEFLGWLDGGTPSATRIEDNIRSFVLVVAAMEASVDGQPKPISRYLE